MLAILLLVFGITMRFMPHAPNFTPVTALALFGGVYLSRRYAVLFPLFLMMISDLFIGMHNTIFFTWGSFILIALIGVWIRNRKNAMTILGASIFSAIIFFVVTNFGAWLTDLYPHTLKGLSTCYTLAIPFFRSTFLSSLLYSGLLFGTYELIAFWVKKTRFARALLTV